VEFCLVGTLDKCSTSSRLLQQSLFQYSETHTAHCSISGASRHTHAHTNKRTRAHKHTRTHVHTHTRTHIHKNAQTHTDIHTYTNTHKYTQIHTCTWTHTHTDTHTHKHTHAYARKRCARNGLCQLFSIASDTSPLVIWVKPEGRRVSGCRGVGWVHKHRHLIFSYLNYQKNRSQQKPR